jgi:hypothetical protein
MFDIKLQQMIAFMVYYLHPQLLNQARLEILDTNTFVIEMQGRLCDTSFGRSVNFQPDSGLVL